MKNGTGKSQIGWGQWVTDACEDWQCFLHFGEKQTDGHKQN